MNPTDTTGQAPVDQTDTTTVPGVEEPVAPTAGEPVTPPVAPMEQPGAVEEPVQHEETPTSAPTA